MGQLINLEDLNEFKNQLFNAIFPVGSIYASAVNTSPASILGGTWTALGRGIIPQNNLNIIADTNLHTGGILKFAREGITAGAYVVGVQSDGALSVDISKSVDEGTSYGFKQNNLIADIQGISIYLWQRTA